MSKHGDTYEKVVGRQSFSNIRFEDLRQLLTRLGFHERVKGSHHILTKDGIAEIINLQAKSGQAKSYQVRQVRGILIRYQIQKP